MSTSINKTQIVDLELDLRLVLKKMWSGPLKMDAGKVVFENVLTYPFLFCFIVHGVKFILYIFERTHAKGVCLATDSKPFRLVSLWSFTFDFLLPNNFLIH